MRALGWAVTILFILGSFDVLDFHVCIKPAGQCEVTK